MLKWLVNLLRELLDRLDPDRQRAITDYETKKSEDFAKITRLQEENVARARLIDSLDERARLQTARIRSLKAQQENLNLQEAELSRDVEKRLEALKNKSSGAILRGDL